MNEELRTDFGGVWTALITPFQTSGSGIDEVLFRKLIERQVEAQARAVVLAGSTGEGPTLSLEEWSTLIKIAAPFRDRIHICVSCGTSSTHESTERLKRAADLGAQSALVSTPAYNKPMPKGVIAHFEALAKAKPNFPLVVYNIPGRTATNISVETMAELWKIPEVMALKESSGNWAQFLDLIETLPAKKNILSGDDPMNIAMIAHGASGTVSVLSNAIPKMLVELVEAVSFGRIAEASEIFYATYPLTKAVFSESNPIGIKYAMGLLMGRDLLPRLPLTRLEEKNAERIKHELKVLGVLA